MCAQQPPVDVLAWMSVLCYDTKEPELLAPGAEERALGRRANDEL